MSSEENAALIATLREAPALSGTTPAEWRQQFDATYDAIPIATGVTRSPLQLSHDLDGEWFRCAAGANSAAAVLFAHGGGYMIGSTRSHGPLMANLAAAAGVDVLGVNYRLAPEYPFPRAVEDMLGGYAYLLENGYPGDRIVIAGDSAGGGLAAALLLAIRDGGLPQPACCVLLSPWLDLTCSAPSLERNLAADPLVRREVLDAMASAYVPDERGRAAELASPLFADLSGLPPLLIQYSTAEVLEDDSVRFADRARSAGVNLTLEPMEGMVHVWHQYAHLIPEARQAITSAGDFIRNQLIRIGEPSS